MQSLGSRPLETTTFRVTYCRKLAPSNWAGPAAAPSRGLSSAILVRLKRAKRQRSSRSCRISLPPVRSATGGPSQLQGQDRVEGGTRRSRFRRQRAGVERRLQGASSALFRRCAAPNRFPAGRRRDRARPIVRGLAAMLFTQRFRRLDASPSSLNPSGESQPRHRSHTECFPAPLQGSRLDGFHPGFRFAPPRATILRRFAAQRL